MEARHMRIGIIGAGFIGQAVARLAVAAGHRAMLSNSRGPDTLADLAHRLGAEAGTPEQAAGFGDVVLVAIPLHQHRAIPVEALAGRIVLDANNYYPARDGRIDELDLRQITTSGLLARHLPRSRIVKAFNAILAADLEKGGQPVASGQPRALPIAADDAAAKAAAARLHEDFGFDWVDAGPLTESWRFERAKPAYCQKLDRDGLIAALAAAERVVELPEGSWRPVAAKAGGRI
jgi:predicted dinucleotide-binding enzyme